jgi:hypothetical protein
LLLRRHIFTKSKKRETLNRSHNDLNITDDNAGLIKNFSTSTELHNVNLVILNFCFWNFLWFFLKTYFFWVCLVNITHNKSI